MRRTPMRRGNWGHSSIADEAERAAAKNRRLASLMATMPTNPPNYAGSTSGEVVAKEDASQSAAYMNAVRDLGYCARCGCSCRPQFCHADQGKGTGIKTDVRRGWAGCASCHHYVGTSGRMRKAARRAEEDRLAFKTRTLVRRAGTWPKNLPDWKEE